MHYQSFNDRMLKKLQNLTWQYAGYIYHAEQTFSEVLGYEIKEHHRQAPNVEYFPVKDGYVWGGEFGNLWVQFDYTVPAELDGKELFVVYHKHTVTGNRGYDRVVCVDRVYFVPSEDGGPDVLRVYGPTDTPVPAPKFKKK